MLIALHQLLGDGGQRDQLLVVLAARHVHLKARDIRVLDVRRQTPITDYMIVASGTSDRHVRSIADWLVQQAEAAGVQALGAEGTGSGEWVLVDLADVVVHVMQPRARDFCKLESLWDMEGAATA